MRVEGRQRRPRRLRRILAVGAVLLLLLLAAAAYFLFGDPARFQDPVEQRVSEALGREVRVHGSFALELLPSPSLVARDVTLAGDGRGDEPFLARVDSIAIRVSLGSLLKRPARVTSVRVRGARIFLEKGEDGRANWEFDVEDAGSGVDDSAPREPFALWESIRLEDVELTYRDPSREGLFRVAIDDLDAGLDSRGLFSVDLDGEVDAIPVRLKGSITSLHRLLEGDALVHELDGSFGNVELELHGRVDDVAELRGVDLRLNADGPDIATITDYFELPSLGSGPFRLEGSAVSVADGVDLTLAADLVELWIDAKGRIDSFAEVRELELTWNVSGADLAAAGALVGWSNLPGGSFELSGRLSGDGERATLDRLRARVGEQRLSVEGVLRTASSFVDQDLGFEAAGPDLSVLSSLAGVRLPGRAYSLAGRLVRRGNRVEVANLSGELGKIGIEVTGEIDEEFRFADAKIGFRARGPGLDAIESLTGVNLPPGAFELHGQLDTAPTKLSFRDVIGHAGETAFELEGDVMLVDRLVGTDLRTSVSGADPSWLVPVIGVESLPVESYRVTGGVRFPSEGLDLEEVAGSYGGVEFGVDGHLGGPPAYDSSDLSIRVSGDDLSWAASLGDVEGLPAEPFDLAGRVRKSGAGYELEGIQASVGEVELVAAGTVGAAAGLEGSVIELEIRGPDLSALSRFPEVPSLPAEPFAASGVLEVGSGSYRLESVSGTLGRHALFVDGNLVPEADTVGSDLRFRLSGPDLADAGRIAGELGLDPVPELPGVEYSVDGRVRVGESDYDVERLTATVAGAEARVEGKLGRLPGAVGTDLRIEGHGPDASILPAVQGTSLPRQPFAFDGRVDRQASRTRFHDLEIELGDYRAAIDGTLGDPPELAPTNLDLRIEGPDLSVLDPFVDEPLPSGGPLEVAAHFDGSPEQFAMRGFKARLGGSDLAGSFEVDLRGDRPRLAAEFVSDRFAMVEFVDKIRSDAGDSGRLFSDEPLELAWLDRLDASVRWTAGEMVHRRGSLHGIELGLEIAGGRLRLDRARASGQDGTYTIALDIAPTDDGYRLEVNGQAEQARLGLFPYSGDPDEIAPVDLEFRLAGSGRSPHAIAASADGAFRILQGSGKIDNSAMTLVGADVLSKLYSALNPFTKSEPFTELECGVFLVEIEDGVAQLGPLAMRTDRVAIVGAGAIDLGAETLSLHWNIKPRKGVGLSASAITNDYIKLTGTLSKPRLTMSPLKAARATGAAVFTGGLSILGRAAFDRMLGERNVCKRALKIGEKRRKRTGQQAEEGS